MKEARVFKIPNCDLCQWNGKTVPAAYDAASKMGKWAFMCEECFSNYGMGLGMGVGQKLVLVPMAPDDDMAYDGG